MIVEISQMITMIEDFVRDQSRYVMDVGGCVGTGIFRICIETVAQFYDFSRILVIEGCQDFVEMQRHRLPNQIFYAESVTSEFDDTFYKLDDPNTPKFMRSDLTVTTNPNDLNTYSIIIVNDAHLIPSETLKMIRNRFYAKIINIVDPFDYKSEQWMSAPTVIDSLNKLSLIQAYARRVYKIETRAIDKNVSCGFKDVGNISIRSVGKRDKHQYVTPSKDIIDLINKRRKQDLRRGQKIICTNKYIDVLKGEDGLDHVFTNHSMGILQSNRQLLNSGSYNVRLHNSIHNINTQLTFDAEHAYHFDTTCIPADIISIDEMRYHKFNSIVLVLPDDKGITLREMYSVLRCTNNLAVGHLKMKAGN
jgi:hypothetical protein